MSLQPAAELSLREEKKEREKVGQGAPPSGGWERLMNGNILFFLEKNISNFKQIRVG